MCQFQGTEVMIEGNLTLTIVMKEIIKAKEIIGNNQRAHQDMTINNQETESGQIKAQGTKTMKTKIFNLKEEENLDNLENLDKIEDQERIKSLVSKFLYLVCNQISPNKI